MKETIRFIRIPSAEIQDSPEKHVSYGILVQGPVRSWTVWRRYSEFDKLNSLLVKKYPDFCCQAKFPPKQISLDPWNLLPKSINAINSFKFEFGRLVKFPTSSQNNKTSDSKDPELKNQNNLDNSAFDPGFIEQRRKALESYVQSILSNPDDRWRNCTEWYDFISPQPKTFKAGEDSASSMLKATSDSASHSAYSDGEIAYIYSGQHWIQEFKDAENKALKIRQLLDLKERASSRNDVSTSHQAFLDAKKLLAELEIKLETLTISLDEYEKSSNMASNKQPQLSRNLTSTSSKHSSFFRAPSPMSTSSSTSGKTNGVDNRNNFVSKGEAIRRRDKLLGLEEQKSSLSQMLKYSYGQSGRKLPSAVKNTERDLLLSSKSSEDYKLNNQDNQPAFKSMNKNQNLNSSQRYSGNKPSTRVFGRVTSSNVPQPTPSESETTVSLDNRELLALHSDVIKEQDGRLEMLSNIIRRQKFMGIEIGNELELQNQLLNEMDEDIDRTNNRLKNVHNMAKKL
ncbi:hypothetical protein BB560_000910 [Smittium megazygosporum]|uniref:t-SNARE coiled-coil homology domain-containing protein n=1 Tax=Smittium megazygosporum TaxID=133381 RepID=A0A2T9ZJ27_9FUNG|nr:hypothetical protein BB560_000910 [Smittium megazygosporum]